MSRILAYLVILCWTLISIISLNHLFNFSELLVLPSSVCGSLYLITIVLSLFYLSRNYAAEAIFVFLIFAGIGWINEPFLEPPGDPIDHLEKAYRTCGKKTDIFRQSNGGLWHYSMVGTILCRTDSENISPEKVLFTINLIHSLMVGILAVGLYAVSKATQLPPFWAVFSLILAFLFFGTNRFSYFSYYSLADSSSSLLIYWLWIAAFFFHGKQKRIDFWMSILGVIILLPILYVNHIQEVIFLGLIFFVWLFLKIAKYMFSNKIRIFQNGFLWTLFIVFFLLPQFDFFQDFLSKAFLIDDWDRNQNHVVYFGPFHIIGKIWTYRVNDTLGLMGFLALPAAIMIIFKKKEMLSYKIAIVGILPLLVYCVPLLHFIWLSNCEWSPTHIRYYYRICYSSLFWVTLANFLFIIEKHLSVSHKAQSLSTTLLPIRIKSTIAKQFCVFCLIGLIFLSTIRSDPVYGKLDFILLESKPWWNDWKPMIQKLMKQNQKPIYTDALTSNVLNGVFNQLTVEKYKEKFYGSKLNIKFMDRGSVARKSRCIINLRGFSPSWIPKETDHWSCRVANTSIYYHYNDFSGDALKDFLKDNLLKNCDVYF